MRRKPKALSADPSVFVPAPGGGAGLVLERAGGAGQRPAPAGGGGSAPGVTEESAELAAEPAPAERSPHEAQVRERARQIAQRLALPRPRSAGPVRRGAGALASLPYRGGSDDIDLDRTVEVLAERPVPEPEDIVVRDRIRTRRSVVLAVDVSGSMRGERVRTAAATVAALAGALHRDDLAVIAFWSDAAVLAPLGTPVGSLRLLDQLLALPARGLTNVAFPLQLAGRQLARIPARDARVVLLSDCVHNAGPDPRPIAGRLPRLDVLLDESGEKDLDLGRELATAGHGRFARIRTYRDVAPALQRAFAD
ncbi:VWA domain-containing protein [Nakamurella sp.]|uniref:vWA domain-containing protein n=1 Tax=Nakamurella sp. TaxID=1869182 RepID=UPI003782D72D